MPCQPPRHKATHRPQQQSQAQMSEKAQQSVSRPCCPASHATACRHAIAASQQPLPLASCHAMPKSHISPMPSVIQGMVFQENSLAGFTGLGHMLLLQRRGKARARCCSAARME